MINKRVTKFQSCDLIEQCIASNGLFEETFTTRSNYKRISSYFRLEMSFVLDY